MFTSDVSQSIVRMHFCSHVQNFDLSNVIKLSNRWRSC